MADLTDSSQPTGDRFPRDAWILASLMLLALALRALNIHNQSFTMDEIAELGIAAAGIRDIVDVADGFPPSYHFLLRGWLGIFGADSAARWLSVLFGVLTIPVIWNLGRDVGGRGVAAWSATLLALAPLHNWFSREARAYSLYVLVAALAMWLFFRALDRNGRADWLAFAVVAVCGVYVHYFFPVLLAVSVLVLALEYRRLDSRKRAVWAYIGIGLASLPVLYLVQTDFAFQAGDTRQTPFDLGALAFTYLSVVTGFTIGPSLRELHTMGLRDAAAGILVWIPPIAVGVGLLAVAGFRALRRSKWKVRLLLFVVGPVLITGGLAALGGIGYRVRYVSWVLIPILVWLAAGIDWGRRRWTTRLALALLLFVMTVSLLNRRTNDRYREEDSRALAEYLVSLPGESRSVFVAADYMVDPVGHYLPPAWRLIPVPRVNEQGAGLEAAVQTILTEQTPEAGFWFVYSREFDGDPAGLIMDSLERGWATRIEAEFAGIELYRVEPNR